MNETNGNNIFSEENTNLFFGFYRGKVENDGYSQINGQVTPDPETRNRIQVRILGLHSQNNAVSSQDGIPLSDLPWAEQAGPIFGGFGANRAGISQVPEVGSWVWVFFDNGNHNKPVYFASILGSQDKDEGQTSGVKTIIKTKSGHKITIDDDTQNQTTGIKVQTQGGHEINFDETSGNEKIILKDGINLTQITLDSNGFELDSLGAGSTEKMVLGESLKTWLSNFISDKFNGFVTTFNSHTHLDTYIPPLIPLPSPVPVIPTPPTSPATPGTPPQDSDFLSTKSKNN